MSVTYDDDDCFIILNSSYVPFIEGLCAQIHMDLRYRYYADIFCFRKKKNVQKKKHLIPPPSIHIQMCTLFTYAITSMQRFLRALRVQVSRPDQICTLMSKNTCITYTPAYALAPHPPQTNTDTPTHARLCNGAASTLPWKLLRTILSLVEASCRLLVSTHLPSVPVHSARRLLAQ